MAVVVMISATGAKANASADAADGSTSKFGFPADAAATFRKVTDAPAIHPSPWYGYGQGPIHVTSEC